MYARLLLLRKLKIFNFLLHFYFQYDMESLNYTSSKLSISRERPQMVSPLSRKDIFYTGSVTNLPEYQSQKSLANYRSQISIAARPSRVELAAEEKVERELIRVIH